MTQRTQNFALGLATMAFIALFLATFIFLYPTMQGGGRAIEIHFEHEHGMAPLKAGSAVLLADAVEVGRVTDVQIREHDGDDGRKRTIFIVRAEISDELPLYGNCRVSTNQPAIGGSGYVSILNVGTPGVPLTGPVRGLPPQSLTAAIGNLSAELLSEGGLIDQLTRAVNPDLEGSLMYKMLASLDDVNAMTRELRVQMSPAEQQALLSKVHRVMDDLNATTAALRGELRAGNDAALLAKLHAALGQLGEGLREATAMLRENRPLVHDTLTSVERAARAMDQELLAALKVELDPTNPAATLGKLHVAMDHVNASLADLRTITTTGERMVVLSRPALEKTLGNFTDMSEQLRLASQEVLLNPSKLIWGPNPEREEKLLVFRAASNFAEAASRLDQAAGRMEAILQVLPAEGQATESDTRELEAVRDAVRTAFERFERAEQILWEQLK